MFGIHYSLLFLFTTELQAANKFKPPLSSFSSGSVVKSWPANAAFAPWVGKIPWRRKWQPTPVFLPGKYHGQRSLVGYSPWGRKRVGRDSVTKQQAAPVSF